jgi:hypothetical protein
VETKESFWRRQDEWWSKAARRLMARGRDGQRVATHEWKEARRRLWRLSYRVADKEFLGIHDRADLVQEILLELLQDPRLLRKLMAMEAPTDYLVQIIRSRIRFPPRTRAANSCISRREGGRIAEFLLCFDGDLSRLVTSAASDSCPPWQD